MKPEAAKKALDALIDSGIDFAACLPDSAFKELYEPLSRESKIDYVQVANEGDGVGICMHFAPTLIRSDSWGRRRRRRGSMPAPRSVRRLT